MTTNQNSNMIKKLLILPVLLLFCVQAFAQDGTFLDNPSYRIKFMMPGGWKERKVEETSNKDAISYTFDKNDGSVAMMILAFRLAEVKNLADLVYTFEKDLTLNIPKRDGEYKEFDKGNFDGMSAVYKDTEFTEIIYYFRTKYAEGENFAYMLRFISPATTFKPATEEELRKLAETFEPSSSQ